MAMEAAQILKLVVEAIGLVKTIADEIIAVASADPAEQKIDREGAMKRLRARLSQVDAAADELLRRKFGVGKDDEGEGKGEGEGGEPPKNREGL